MSTRKHDSSINDTSYIWPLLSPYQSNYIFRLNLPTIGPPKIYVPTELKTGKIQCPAIWALRGEGGWNSSRRIWNSIEAISASFQSSRSSGSPSIWHPDGCPCVQENTWSGGNDSQRRTIIGGSVSWNKFRLVDPRLARDSRRKRGVPWILYSGGHSHSTRKLRCTRCRKRGLVKCRVKWSFYNILTGSEREPSVMYYIDQARSWTVMFCSMLVP